MNDDYKILRNRANYLLLKSILHAGKVFLFYIAIYFATWYITLFVMFNGRLEPGNVDYSAHEVISFVPKFVPLDQSTLTGFCALVLALFINVRGEVKDIDELPRNAQIRAVSYKKFANLVIYIVSFIVFSHSVNSVYKMLVDGYPVENFNPSFLTLILFAAFILVISALPGEHRLSLEAQWKEKLNDLIVFNNINIKNKLDFQDISQSAPEGFYKYYSRYSYNKPYLSYFASLSGYISLRKYLYIYIIYYFCISLLFIFPVLALYAGDLIYDPVPLFKLCLLGFVGNFLISLFCFFIYPLPILFSSYNKDSPLVYYPLQILHYIGLSILWGGALSYTGIRLIEVFNRKYNIGYYNIFELLGVVWYLSLVIFIPAAWWFLRRIFIKYLGQKSLGISKTSVGNVLYFAESWYKWTEAEAIYEEAFFYRNSMSIDNSEIPDTDYSEFLDYYTEYKSKLREINKRKKYKDNNSYKQILPGDTRVTATFNPDLANTEDNCAEPEVGP